MATLGDFLKADADTIVGQLATNGSFALLPTQRDAWLAQIDLLRDQLAGPVGWIFLEFNIPRMGRRIDAVLLIDHVVFVVEFKVGSASFDRAAEEQVWDYALDLKNFHEASHGLPIIPILIATGAAQPAPFVLQADADRVYRPIFVHTTGLRAAISAALSGVAGDPIDAPRWANSSYRPTPTIIEAAQSLYAQHSVEAIARHDAGAQNLHLTSQYLEQLIDEARATKRKIICFVTGVPGAGKTLVGLNLATRRRDETQATHAVFLSGNGPLVAVLREALVRDEVAHQKRLGVRKRKGDVGKGVKAFIQNVHHFRDEALIDEGPPDDHVVIFDEAQRAWNLHQTASFMLRKKNRKDFNQSEPQFLISCMNRHLDWAAVICLVGGGQEINTGEAGIEAWIAAILSEFPDWHMYISSRLFDSEYAAGNALTKAKSRVNTHTDDSLHLAVSMRSFRAEHVSAFVKALLDCELAQARAAHAQICARYPIAITRNLAVAKRWIRAHARGSERFGLLASSKAQRLRPHAIDIRVEVDPIHWFLNGKEDVRSSYYLEDAATEFQVQGLELDWACVTWDGDMRFAGNSWTCHDFRGTRWENVHKVDNQRYVLNAYRVLLTRARQGMVIFVPQGDMDDPTRSPDYYDATYRYLTAAGIPPLT